MIQPARTPTMYRHFVLILHLVSDGTGSQLLDIHGCLKNVSTDIIVMDITLVPSQESTQLWLKEWLHGEFVSTMVAAAEYQIISECGTVVSSTSTN